MKDAFEEFHKQIHELRNLIGPVNLKLASIEEAASTLEARVLANAFKNEEQDTKISELLFRITKLERRLDEIRPPGR